MSTTIQEGKFLSDLLGAHDISDFVPEVVGVSPTSPPLERGDVVCMIAASQDITLAGSQGTKPADAYGILLDYAINPVTQPNVNATVARSGVFDATMLRVDASVTLAAFAPQLRSIGIFLEKLNLVK